MSPSRFLVFFALLSVFLPGPTARADDITLHASVLSMRLRSPGATGNGETLTSFAPSLVILWDLTPQLAAGLALQPLANFKDGEVTRSAADAVAELVLLGSRHAPEVDYDEDEGLRPGAWSVNLIARLGAHRYRAPERDDGSTAQALAGIGARLDVTEESSVGVEALYTLASVATGRPALTAEEAQAGLYYRFGF